MHLKLRRSFRINKNHNIFLCKLTFNIMSINKQETKLGTNCKILKFIFNRVHHIMSHKILT